MEHGEIQTLLLAALQARQRAYAPYSGYGVGAALMSIDNNIYTGCNIENASYPVTCCGERAALFQAVSQGVREFAAIAVVGGKLGHAPPFSAYAYPCGICRQALAEFAPNLLVVVGKSEDDYELYNLKDLLPKSFTGSSVK